MKRALVLCGGGSLGSYEVGAWRYFREVGIDFDIITGTSIGAINGALVAADAYERAVKLWQQVAADKVMTNGMNFPRDFLSEFDWKSDARKLNHFAKSYVKHGGADITPFINWVKNAIPVHDVKMSPKKLGIVTTSFPLTKEIDVVLNEVPEENILDYLHASSACFPVFPVYTFNGKSYIDGGYYNNLPIDFALRLGADEIYAVLLRAVPKIPQHSELMRLPCVTTVLPSRDTGSIMDFEKDVVMKNMELGYNDAAKRLGKYWGYAFTFLPNPRFNHLVKSFDHDLARDNIYTYFKITKSLDYLMFHCESALDVFLRSIEIIGEWLNLDYMKVYTIEEYIVECQKVIRNEENTERGLEFAKNKTNWGLHLSPSDRLPFVLYMDYVYKHNLPTDRIQKVTLNNPEVASIEEVLKFLKKMKLL